MRVWVSSGCGTVVEGLMACMDPSGIPRLNLEEVGLPSEDTIDAVALLQWRPGKNGGCVTDRDEAISVFVMKKGKVHSQASPVLCGLITITWKTNPSLFI